MPAKTEWLCDWFECKNYVSPNVCSADPYHIYCYLSNCPEFEPIDFEDFPDIEDLPF